MKVIILWNHMFSSSEQQKKKSRSTLLMSREVWSYLVSRMSWRQTSDAKRKQSNSRQSCSGLMSPNIKLLFSAFFSHLHKPLWTFPEMGTVVVCVHMVLQPHPFIRICSILYAGGSSQMNYRCTTVSVIWIQTTLFFVCDSFHHSCLSEWLIHVIS